MSANTIKKAKKLVESGGVEKIDEDLYQIKFLQVSPWKRTKGKLFSS